MLVILFVSICLFSRINENYEQIEKRYGDPTFKEDPYYRFEFKGFTIDIAMYEGKSVTVIYQKIGKILNKEITSDEVSILIESNLGKDYQKIDSSDYSTDLYIKGEFGVMHNKFKNQLLFVHKENNEKLQQSLKKKKEKEMEGF